jgi:hypothetical protein
VFVIIDADAVTFERVVYGKFTSDMIKKISFQHVDCRGTLSVFVKCRASRENRINKLRMGKNFEVNGCGLIAVKVKVKSTVTL